MSLARLPTPFWAAVILCLANVPKPATIDDGAYYCYARHMAELPADPYGFTIIWYQYAAPAPNVLAPPVLPAWWALGIRLLGDHPMLWKLWLFPFCWVFAASLHSLFRRFCPGLERPLTAMTVLAPAFLPALNFMLDVPAMALTLAGIAILIRSYDDCRWSLVVAAGLVLGVAMQTKYTGFIGPAVVLLYGVIFRRWWSALFAAGVAVAVFVGWEAWFASKYGQSHFVFHLEANNADIAAGDGFWQEKLKLVPPLFGYLGGLGPAVALGGWAALGARRAVLIALAAFFVGGFILIGVVPMESQIWTYDPVSGYPRLTLNSVFMGASSVLVLVPVMVTGGKWKSLREREGLFLVLWFWGEVASYFVLTPFPGARRVMGLVVVSTLVVGRYASHFGAKRSFDAIAWFGIALGAFYATVDAIDARPEQIAIQRCAEAIPREASSTTWYVGHWGFQFYADRAGMRPVHPDRSELAPGDYLVVPDPGYRPVAQSITVDPDSTEAVFRAEVELPMPYRTVPNYYGGYTPIVGHEGPRVGVTVYRVTRRWKPQTFWP